MEEKVGLSRSRGRPREQAGLAPERPGHKRKPSRAKESHPHKDKEKEKEKEHKKHGKKKDKSASTEDIIRDELSFRSSGSAIDGVSWDKDTPSMAAFEADKLRVQQLANNLEQSQQITNQMVILLQTLFIVDY